MSKNHQVTKRGIQLALGGLWLLDGLLQLQPRMFTADFANNVILPAAQGQPSFVSDPMHFFASIFLWNPVLSNLGIVIVQISLGILILWKHTARLGLILSVVWGLFVWYIGEGLSGLASGHAMMLMGSPGAALIYAVLALGVLAVKAPKSNNNKIDQRPAYWLQLIWIAIWVVGAVYQMMPGQNTIADTSSMISANADGAPSWLASLDTATASYLNTFDTANSQPSPMTGMPGMSTSQPVSNLDSTDRKASGSWFLGLLVLLQILIGLAVVLPGRIRLLAVIVGSLLSLGFWIVGQSLGGFYTGTATDPNTGPLLILLGIAVLRCTQRDSKVRSFFARIHSNFIEEIRALNEA